MKYKIKRKIKKLMASIMIVLIVLSQMAIITPFSYATVNIDDVLANARKIVELSKKGQARYELGGGHGNQSNPNQTVFDCSGFVGWCYTQAGHPITGNTAVFISGSFSGAEEVGTNPANWKPGDVLVNSEHTAIYTGNGNIVEAAYYGIGIVERPNWMTPTHVFRVKGATSRGVTNSTDGKDEKFLSNWGVKIEEHGKFFYEGTPKSQAVIDGQSLGSMIINFFSQILLFLINLLLYIIRLPFVGFAALTEYVVTSMMETISGIPSMSAGLDVENNLDSSKSVTMENIIFDRIEILKVDFFVSPEEVIKRMEGKTGTGVDIKKVNDRVDRVGESQTEQKYVASEELKKNYEESGIGLIRSIVARAVYVSIIFAVTISFVLALVSSILGMISSVATQKSMHKETAFVWIRALGLTFTSVFLMVAIVKFNSALVDLLYRVLYTDQLVSNSVYETVRTRAYAFQATVGFAGLVMYIILIYFTIRFLFIYFKRLFNLIILTLAGVLLPVYAGFNEVLRKQKGLYTRWLKEYFANVIMQTIHVLAFAIFATISLKAANESFASFILMIFFIKAMLTLSEEAIQTFKLEGGLGFANEASRADVMGIAAITGYYLGRGQMEKGKKRVKKGMSATYEKGAKLTEATVRNTYNIVQAGKEKIFGVGNVNIPAQQTSDPQTNVPTPAPQSKEGIEAEERLNKTITNAQNVNAQIDPVDEEKETVLDRIMNSRMAKFGLRVKENFRFRNHVYIDEQGRKRMLPPKVTYDPKTGKILVDKKIRKQLQKDLRAIFNMEKGELKALLSLGKETGISFIEISRIFIAVPMFIGNKRFASLLMANSNISKIYGSLNKKDEAYRKKKAKRGIPYEEKIGIKRYLKLRKKMKKSKYHPAKTSALAQVRLIDQLYDEMLMEMKERRKERTFKVDQELRKEIGKKFRSRDGKTILEIWEANKAIAKVQEMKLLMLQIDAETRLQETLQEMGYSIDKSFLESTRKEDIDKVIDRVEGRTFARKVTHAEMATKVSELERVKKEINTIYKEDQISRDISIGKAVDDMADIVADKAIERMSSIKLSEVNEAKVQEIVDKLLSDNSVFDQLDQADRETIYRITRNKVNGLANSEVSTRETKDREQIEYRSERVTKSDRKRLDELKERNIEDLSISELIDLQKDVVRAYIEQDRYVEDIIKELEIEKRYGTILDFKDSLKKK